MLGTVADQPSWWEAILPEEPRRLLLELSRVDALLDDPPVLHPVRAVRRSAAGAAVDADGTYLRLMFLKFRYRAGFESWCREVSDSLPLAAVRPDRDRPAGAAPDDADEPHHPVRIGRGGRVERGVVGKRWPRRRCCAAPGSGSTPPWRRRIWAYPTDSGLLAKAVHRIAATGRRIRVAGGAVRTELRDRSRAAGRRADDLNANLRTRSAAR
jgi:transposase, IS5 family